MENFWPYRHYSPNQSRKRVGMQVEIVKRTYFAADPNKCMVKILHALECVIATHVVR